MHSQFIVGEIKQRVCCHFWGSRKMVHLNSPTSEVLTLRVHTLLLTKEKTGEPPTCKTASMGTIMCCGTFLHIRNLVFSAGTQRLHKFTTVPLYSYVAQTL